jgi:hypothetical protein
MYDLSVVGVGVAAVVAIAVADSSPLGELLMI